MEHEQNAGQTPPQIPDMEAVYDDKIHPLMNQIIKVCQEHGMPMVACFQFSETGFCTTVMAQQNADARIPMAATLLRKGFLAMAVSLGVPPEAPAGGSGGVSH